MRKFVLAAVAVTLTAGLALADKGKFVKFDGEKKELTLKVGKKDAAKEVVFTVTKDTKFLDADGKELSMDDAVKLLTDKEKAPKQLDVTHEKDSATLTAVKWVKAKPKTDKAK